MSMKIFGFQWLKTMIFSCFLCKNQLNQIFFENRASTVGIFVRFNFLNFLQPGHLVSQKVYKLEN